MFRPARGHRTAFGATRELGFSETLYLNRSQQLTDFLDAYGFDAYAFSTNNEKIDLDHLTTPVVPGGDNLHTTITAH
ncbi:MAG: hypothetical protein IPM59_12130 [Chloracidobacterium sp.]|nr:hypothetical protein [Chloracidobacterium sp.]